MCRISLPLMCPPMSSLPGPHTDQHTSLRLLPLKYSHSCSESHFISSRSSSITTLLAEHVLYLTLMSLAVLRPCSHVHYTRARPLIHSISPLSPSSLMHISIYASQYHIQM